MCYGAGTSMAKPGAAPSQLSSTLRCALHYRRLGMSAKMRRLRIPQNVYGHGRVRPRSRAATPRAPAHYRAAPATGASHARLEFILAKAVASTTAKVVATQASSAITRRCRATVSPAVKIRQRAKQGATSITLNRGRHERVWISDSFAHTQGRRG